MFFNQAWITIFIGALIFMSIGAIVASVLLP